MDGELVGAAAVRRDCRPLVPHFRKAVVREQPRPWAGFLPAFVQMVGKSEPGPSRRAWRDSPDQPVKPPDPQ